MRLNNFSEYVPEYKAEPLESAIYLEAETGEDWYFHRQRFSPDKMKICFDSEGVIRSFSRDVSELWPLNMSVVELDKVPDDLCLSNRWRYDGKAVVKNPGYDVTAAEIRRHKELLNATIEIGALSDAVEEAKATTKETQRLSALKAYRLAIYRIDPAAAPDITWPDAP